MADANNSVSMPKGIVDVAVIFFIWSLLTFFVRVWVKRRAWAFDDTAIAVALLFILGNVISVLKVSGSGFPQPWSELKVQERLEVSKMLYVAQIFYVLALGTVRISSGIFNTRLTLDPGNSLIATCITISCCIWTIVSLLLVALRGDFTEPWLTQDGSYTMYLRWMGIEITGGLLELIMWTLSVCLIARLNMAISKKAYLSVIFGCRLSSLPFTVLRLINLSPSRNLNQDSPPVTAYVFGELAVNAALIAASITCLKPFLRPFDTGYTHTNRVNDISGGIKNSRGDTYYMLSATRSNNDYKQSTITSRLSERGTERDNEQGINAPAPSFRPAGFKNHATVESQELPHNNSRTDNGKMTISMTQGWEVKYEN